MNGLIGELIQSASLQKTNNFLTKKTRRHAYSIAVNPVAQSRIALHKSLCRELVYGSSALKQIEYKGQQILGKLATIYLENYLSPAEPTLLVPPDVHRAVTKAGEPASKARLLCDHLSGMTDAYALRSYKRLLDPDYGSISELI
jgi:dGTPase